MRAAPPRDCGQDPVVLSLSLHDPVQSGSATTAAELGGLEARQPVYANYGSHTQPHFRSGYFAQSASS